MIREAIKGAALAAAVCSLFAAGAAQADDKMKDGAKVVHCGGINSCKGQGSCAGADNSCKAQNDCKGKGWVETSAKECKEKGGKVVASKM
jgi:uncharacterized membrane protein